MIRMASDSLSTQSSLAKKKGTTKWLSDEMSISSDRAAGRLRQRERRRREKHGESCSWYCVSTINAHALYTVMDRDDNLMTNTAKLRQT